MSWENILKDTDIGGASVDLGDGRELITDNLKVDIELKEISGSYRRKHSVFGDKVSPHLMPKLGYSTFGEYQFAFLPKLTGFAEIIDEAGVVKEKFRAENIEVFFEGGSFKNIKSFPVPIDFKIELDFDEVPIIYITMDVA